MKVCTICHVKKPTLEYNKHAKTKDGLQSVCRDCNKARSRQYYKDNKIKHLETIKKRQKALIKAQRELVKSYKESNPCTDCGNFFPYYVMDLDHLSDKISIVSAMFGKYSTKKILEEIEKCELVCANCHRIRTHMRASS